MKKRLRFFLLNAAVSLVSSAFCASSGDLGSVGSCSPYDGSSGTLFRSGAFMPYDGSLAVLSHADSFRLHDELSGDLGGLKSSGIFDSVGSCSPYDGSSSTLLRSGSFMPYDGSSAVLSRADSSILYDELSGDLNDKILPKQSGFSSSKLEPYDNYNVYFKDCTDSCENFSEKCQCDESSMISISDNYFQKSESDSEHDFHGKSVKLQEGNEKIQSILSDLIMKSSENADCCECCDINTTCASDNASEKQHADLKRMDSGYETDSDNDCVFGSLIATNSAMQSRRNSGFVENHDEHSSVDILQIVKNEGDECSKSEATDFNRLLEAENARKLRYQQVPSFNVKDPFGASKLTAEIMSKNYCGEKAYDSDSLQFCIIQTLDILENIKKKETKDQNFEFALSDEKIYHYIELLRKNPPKAAPNRRNSAALFGESDDSDDFQCVVVNGLEIFDNFNCTISSLLGENFIEKRMQSTKLEREVYDKAASNIYLDFDSLRNVKFFTRILTNFAREDTVFTLAISYFDLMKIGLHGFQNFHDDAFGLFFMLREEFEDRVKLDANRGEKRIFCNLKWKFAGYYCTKNDARVIPEIAQVDGVSDFFLFSDSDFFDDPSSFAGEKNIFLVFKGTCDFLRKFYNLPYLFRALFRNEYPCVADAESLLSENSSGAMNLFVGFFSDNKWSESDNHQKISGNVDFMRFLQDMKNQDFANYLDVLSNCWNIDENLSEKFEKLRTDKNCFFVDKYYRDMHFEHKLDWNENNLLCDFYDANRVFIGDIIKNFSENREFDLLRGRFDNLYLLSNEFIGMTFEESRKILTNICNFIKKGGNLFILNFVNDKQLSSVVEKLSVDNNRFRVENVTDDNYIKILYNFATEKGIVKSKFFNIFNSPISKYVKKYNKKY